jgi:two-component system sensor histidine kinase PilS (NtrC family)
MPASSPTAGAPPSDFALRVFALVNLFRLLVPLMLLGLVGLAGTAPLVQATRPKLMMGICVTYLIVAIALILGRRWSHPSARMLVMAHAAIDSIAIGLLLYAAGGAASGLGILLVLPLGAMTLIASDRDSLLIAAGMSLVVLLQQFAVFQGGTAAFTDFGSAGVLGAVLFTVALSVWPVANRLRESEARVSRQAVDLENLAQLSQYIVQHLRESILVVDSQDRVRLINESAATILGSAARAGALVGEVSPRLLYLLETWRTVRGAPAEPSRTFVADDGARVIQANFVSLGDDDPKPVLVFLEDTSALAEKVQQSKLAALGRLSASIAHEIRNPIGAMSHAAQLLGESPDLGEGDRRLTEIMRTNATRVSAIIDSILQLSRRESSQPDRLSLRGWLEEFCQEFCETMQWPAQRLTVEAPEAEVEVTFDATHLRQVVWNLCENAIRHGMPAGNDGPVEIRIGRLGSSGRPYLEVADRGDGVAAEQAERIFEPFYSGERRGTGLGLFLARELAQMNSANLIHEPRPGGGSIFRLVFADPDRWEVR